MGLLAGDSVSLDDVCDPVPALHWKGNTRRTRLRAQWQGCRHLSGRVKLRAVTKRKCTELRGVVKARFFTRRFRAKLSECGDGIVDPGRGEQCDDGNLLQTDGCLPTCMAGPSTTVMSTTTSIPENTTTAPSSTSLPTTTSTSHTTSTQTTSTQTTNTSTETTSTSTGTTSTTTSTIAFPTEGVLLEGDPGAPAVSAVYRFVSLIPLLDTEVEVDARSHRVRRTHLSVAFSPEATIGQVNAALVSIDARIVGMNPGVPVVQIRFADPGSLADLRSLAATLAAEAGIDDVALSTGPALHALPGLYAERPATALLDTIDHQLTVGAAALWNGRAALEHNASSQPLLLITDIFGQGPPSSDFDIDLRRPTLLSGFASEPTPGTRASTYHGYHVLGIISARYRTDVAPTTRESITGLIPARSPVSVIDMSGLHAFATSMDRWFEDMEEEMIAHAVASGSRIVINTSLGECGNELTSCDDVDDPEYLAKVHTWRRRVRNTRVGPSAIPLEQASLHVVSAGNVVASAATSSRYAAAGMVLGDEEPSAALANVIVVEGREQPPIVLMDNLRTGCLFQRFGPIGSGRRGDLSAIATDIRSFTGPIVGTGDHTGTSQAAPQVAALAAMVWAAKPQWTAGEVKALLQATARTDWTDIVCLWVPAPLIDAYTAMTFTDGATPSRPHAPDEIDAATAPFRNAVLDVDDDGQFTNADFAAFATRFLKPDGTMREPSEMDFSRYDLNGDGFTGGSDRHARFDLDLDRKFEQPWVGTASTPPTTELELTDLDILCAYARSGLFVGDRNAGEPSPLQACLRPMVFEGQAIVTDLSGPQVSPGILLYRNIASVEGIAKEGGNLRSLAHLDAKEVGIRFANVPVVGSRPDTGIFSGGTVSITAAGTTIAEGTVDYLVYAGFETVGVVTLTGVPSGSDPAFFHEVKALADGKLTLGNDLFALGYADPNIVSLSGEVRVGRVPNPYPPIPDDPDGDGHGTTYDNCPNDPNPLQTDWDLDGVGDDCSCPCWNAYTLSFLHLTSPPFDCSSSPNDTYWTQGSEFARTLLTQGFGTRGCGINAFPRGSRSLIYANCRPGDCPSHAACRGSLLASSAMRDCLSSK